jgi:hypothetical protein
MSGRAQNGAPVVDFTLVRRPCVVSRSKMALMLGGIRRCFGRGRCVRC